MSTVGEQWSPDLLKDIDNVIFDCDGVLYNHEKPIPGAKKALRTLKDMGKNVVFCTNNSTKSRAQYVESFKKLFGATFETTQIFPTSFAIAKYLSNRGFHTNGKKVYVIGLKGITDELKDAGIPFIWSEQADKPENFSSEAIAAWNGKIDRDIGAVVMGFTHRSDFLQKAYAVRALKISAETFVCANYESEFLISDINMPACGPIVAFVENASKKLAVNCGKPGSLLFELISKSVVGGLERDRTLMIGDRLDTDIAFGKNNNIKTLLVFSGQTDKDKYFADIRENVATPDYWANSFAELVENLSYRGGESANKRNNCGGEFSRKKRRL